MLFYTYLNLFFINNIYNYFQYTNIKYNYKNNPFIVDLNEKSYDVKITNFKINNLYINDFNLFYGFHSNNNLKINHFIKNSIQINKINNIKQILDNSDCIEYKIKSINFKDLETKCHHFYKLMIQYLQYSNLDKNYRLINNCYPKLYEYHTIYKNNTYTKNLYYNNSVYLKKNILKYT